MAKDFLLMAAPLEGVSNTQWRARCYSHGADLTFTEMIRVANIIRGKKGEKEKIGMIGEVPTQIQLAGAKLNEYEKYLKSFEPEIGFRGFNLNLGCPSPGFIMQGCGAAMIKRASRVGEIVKLISDCGFSSSVKLRLGLNKYEKEKGTYLNLIEKVDASFFVVHARTADQTEKNPADFSVYSKCVKTGKDIVANGDIENKMQVEKLKNDGLYGAMIGRAAMEDQIIFEKLR